MATSGSANNNNRDALGGNPSGKARKAEGMLSAGAGSGASSSSGNPAGKAPSRAGEVFNVKYLDDVPADAIIAMLVWMLDKYCPGIEEEYRRFLAIVLMLNQKENEKHGSNISQTLGKIPENVAATMRYIPWHHFQAALPVISEPDWRRFKHTAAALGNGHRLRKLELLKARGVRQEVTNEGVILSVMIKGKEIKVKEPTLPTAVDALEKAVPDLKLLYSQAKLEDEASIRRLSNDGAGRLLGGAGGEMVTEVIKATANNGTVKIGDTIGWSIIFDGKTYSHMDPGNPKDAKRRAYIQALRDVFGYKTEEEAIEASIEATRSGYVRNSYRNEFKTTDEDTKRKYESAFKN